MLRIDDPFVTNRRVTTGPVDHGPVRLPEGARVKLHWTSANRDEEASATRKPSIQSATRPTTWFTASAGTRALAVY